MTFWKTERSRWLAMSVLVLSSSLNYLDRSMLSALMPTLREEFSVSGETVGWVIAAFSIPYALGSPLMGLLLDRMGVRNGAASVVGLWSLAGMSTGFVSSLGGLMVSRGLLGFGESGGIPAVAKGSATYLEPKDRALGSAISQVGLTIGMVAAPLMTEMFAAWYGWRAAFIAAGALGFLWIPAWLVVSRGVQAARVPSDPVSVPHGRMLRDRRLWVLIAANMLAMTTYSLWTVWTTQFLVSVFGLTQRDANLRLAWWPSIFATLGGLLGGWIAQRQIRSGVPVAAARLRIAMLSSMLVFVTALAPALPTAALSTAAVCLSLFATTCLSVNYYAIPLDLFGADRAGFAVSLLTASYGLMQAFLSPQIGGWSDAVGWQPVCSAVAALPLASALLLRTVIRPA